MLASITHDLKTPLNSILTFNAALSALVANNEKAKKLLRIQKNSCVFMQSTIEDILDISRI